jgi:hypothetical protein
MRVVEKTFGILDQKFKIHQRTLQSLPENADIFTTCILHNYLREQGVGLSGMGSSANVRSNLTKISNQGGSAHQSAFQETNLINSLIIHLDLCLGRIKECNFRLIYNIQLGWMFS